MLVANEIKKNKLEWRRKHKDIPSNFYLTKVDGGRNEMDLQRLWREVFNNGEYFNKDVEKGSSGWWIRSLQDGFDTNLKELILTLNSYMPKIIWKLTQTTSNITQQ